LITALVELSKIGVVEKKSSIFVSEPYGVKNQFNFLNAVCILKFDQSPHRLLRAIKKIESKIGRQVSFRWGPREIDIDILDWEGEPISSEILTVPHEEIKLRNFVLLPLQEIDSEYCFRNGDNIEKIIKLCPDKTEVKYYDDQW